MNATLEGAPQVVTENFDLRESAFPTRDASRNADQLRNALHAAAIPFTPTTDYTRRDLAGFQVYVHPTVMAMDKTNETVSDLKVQLERISKVVSEPQLAALKRIPFWVEWNSRPEGAAECHVSAQWLKENGYNPDKLHGVEITNAKNFREQSRDIQPYIAMHELAHAYHYTVLGGNSDLVRAAYENAMSSKIYDSVPHIVGGSRRAYAMVNETEYFAELTEAYFGKNDYYPFTEHELQRHDPVGFSLMQQVWGELRPLPR